jgi:hypothetical protein
MSHGRFNHNGELNNPTQGKKPKVEIGLLVYLVMDEYPAIRWRLGRAFSIYEG